MRVASERSLLQALACARPASTRCSPWVPWSRPQRPQRPQRARDHCLPRANRDPRRRRVGEAAHRRVNLRSALSDGRRGRKSTPRRGGCGRAEGPPPGRQGDGPPHGENRGGKPPRRDPGRGPGPPGATAPPSVRRRHARAGVGPGRGDGRPRALAPHARPRSGRRDPWTGRRSSQAPRPGEPRVPAGQGRVARWRCGSNLVVGLAAARSGPTVAAARAGA